MPVQHRVRRRDRGALEREVLAALGAAGRPLTPAQVLSELGADLAYTTVMTTLARMAGRGIHDRYRVGRAYVYTPVRDPATLTARRMRRLLDTDANRAGVLARFVAELGPDDERVLAALLEETTDPSPPA